MTADLEHTVLDAHTVILVEGMSDQLAVEALAARCGRDLAAEGTAVVAMGGATNIGHFLSRFGPAGLNLRLAGLCDEAEMRFFQRGLDLAGVGCGPSRSELESCRFYVCVRDLEDELIRALGVAVLEHILGGQGDLASFRTFQQQPAQRGKSDHARLRRFMGTRGGRKIHYAPVLVDALDLTRIPSPLERLLASV